jgi:uncharacterized protein (DUF1501 family)
MKHFHILSRRHFLSYASKAGVAAAVSSLLDIPLVAKRALAADSQLGRNGKKLLFIFLRGANDSLNSVAPVQDPAYATSRPTIGIPKDPATNYAAMGSADMPFNTSADAPTYSYANGIRLGNGFMALHPSLKFLTPLYNAGDLALIHRVGYPKQSRSHFDSQNYWETGTPNDNTSKDGLFYRTIIESGLAQTNSLTGVSFQSSLPLILRGSQAALTNLSDPSRYNLLGIPNAATGNAKADAALLAANQFPFPMKKARELLSLQYGNMADTLSTFADIDFEQNFLDSANTNGDTVPYNLFPTSNAQNGGYAAHANDTSKYVVSPSQYSYFDNLKSAAIVLNKTDAIIAGTELGGFDTHSNQGSVTGNHSNLQQAIGWSMYALKEYFKNNADKLAWDNLVVVTLSEFGRTTVENSDQGTDHAEAGVMFLAGGAVKGYGKGNASGVFGGSPNDSIPWVPGSASEGGSMFSANSRYLKRVVDYRSVLGKLIRDHLGASQDQLNRIIPGYAKTGEALQRGGISTIDAAKIMGELPVV